LRLRVVLTQTSHPGNIGAAARAMQTMGLGDLALVRPRHFPHADATAMAAGGADLLERATVHATLQEALSGCVLAVGFSARRRDLSHAVQALRDAASGIVEATAAGPVALVFGNETSGLSNAELAQCQAFASIPANPAYSSLNLAAAVQVACYEVSVAAGAHAAPVGRERLQATVDDLDALVAHLESAARDSGFLDPRKPGRFVEHMRRLFARSKLERSEVKLLRGLLGALEAKAATRKRSAPSPRRSPPRSRKRS
jgi:tRNA/rRNA methyltransferase